jgi:hypothetical protein
MSEEDPFDELEDADPDADPFADLGDAASGDDPVPDAGTAVGDPAGPESPEDGETAEGEFVEMDSADDPSVSVEETNAGAEAVVPKRSYCERCEFFSAPPSVRCTNPGTEILELVDYEHFRVVDCPVVDRRGETGFELHFEGDSG